MVFYFRGIGKSIAIGKRNAASSKQQHEERHWAQHCLFFFFAAELLYKICLQTQPRTCPLYHLIAAPFVNTRQHDVRTQNITCICLGFLYKAGLCTNKSIHKARGAICGVSGPQIPRSHAQLRPPNRQCFYLRCSTAKEDKIWKYVFVWYLHKLGYRLLSH